LSVCRVHDREEHEGGSDTKLRLLRNKFIWLVMDVNYDNSHHLYLYV
jgi:hypothetical protein